MNYFRVSVLSSIVIGFIICLAVGSFFYKKTDDLSSISDAMYEVVMSDDSSEKIISLLNSVISSKGRSNYKILAKFKLAAIFSSKELRESQKIYEKLASEKSIDKYLRNLAEYLEIVSSTKNEDFKVFKNKISKSMESANNIYWIEMKQLLAISMIRNGEINSALEILKEIENDSDANFIMRNSVKELLSIYNN